MANQHVEVGYTVESKAARVLDIADRGAIVSSDATVRV